jgi:hypothetical protein
MSVAELAEIVVGDRQPFDEGEAGRAGDRAARDRDDRRRAGELRRPGDVLASDRDATLTGRQRQRPRDQRARVVDLAERQVRRGLSRLKLVCKSDGGWIKGSRLEPGDRGSQRVDIGRGASVDRLDGDQHGGRRSKVSGHWRLAWAR